MKQKIMSGMRPTGKLHLGHYLGVIDNWVKLQEEYDCYFSVADWHALTTKYDKTETMKEDVLNVVMDWLACGIDPDKATIYVQSLVPETAELHIYLSMITPQNWVERDPTLKDMAKILKSKEGMASQINYGSSKCVGGSDEHRVPSDDLDCLFGLGDAVDTPGDGNGLSDPLHGLLEQLPVLGHGDCIGLCSHEDGTEPVQLTGISELRADVECCLSTHSGDDSVDTLLLYDLGHILGQERLDVDSISSIGVGLDGCRV